MDELLRNVRHSVRSLLKRPGFTAIAVLTLALGIGATTAIFSVVRNVLLRPLPYDAPERIVQVWNPFSNEPGVQRGRSALSSLDLAEMREAVTSFEQLAAYASQASVNLTGGDMPERVTLIRASADLFAVLGASALVGRIYTADEDVPGRDDVVVISYALWQRRFGGDRNIVNSVIDLDGVPHRVLGVLSPTFRLPADYLRDEQTEVWRPLALDADNLDRANHWLHAVARLRPDATLARANAELEALTRAWIEQGFKTSTLPPYYAVSIQDELFSGSRRALMILFGAVSFVLLIACANVANLLLARADGRRSEMALRTALGAGRSRIVTQLLWESAVLVLFGGLLGLLLAWVGVQLLVALEPGNIPRIGEVRIDGMTLGFTAAVALVTAGIFGLVPAIQAWRPDPAVELRSGMRTIGGRRAAGFRGALIVAEVALSLVLVIGAALLIRTFAQLSRVDPGFDAESVLTFTVALPLAQYDEPVERVQFHSALVQRLRGIPGVQDAGAVMTLPLTVRLSGGSIEIEGAPPRRPGEAPPNARWQIVTPGYFETMDYTLTEGRLLSSTDRADGAPAVVINETMARMFWPDRPALGERVRTANGGVPWFTVAGIVRDVHHTGIIEQPSPTIYVTLEQAAVYAFAPRAMTFVLETTGAPLDFADRVRDAVRTLDPTLPVAQVLPMETVLDDALAQPRFTMLLLSIFAALALALAIIGIYGLLSYTVTRQWRDIGIRVALGASIGTVLRHVIWQGMRLTIVGLATGVIAALFLARLLERMLYGVRPLDTVTFVVVPALFTTAALAATWIPARRAAGVDPVRALRHE